METNANRLTDELILRLKPFQRRSAGLPQGEIIMALAQGAPLPLERVAALSDDRPERVARLLRILGAEFDDDGRLVGLGLTLRPTQHRFRLDGTQLYTWCALDTLIFPRFLGPAHVESPCRATGTPVRLTVSPERVESLEPPEAVVSIRSPQAGGRGATIRQAFCEWVHFFKSADAAAPWHEEHPEAAIVSVAEAFELGGRLSAETFGIATTERGNR